MTKTELITSALREYETARGRPCTDAVIIAQELNRPGRGENVTTVQEDKHPIQVADEQMILSFVREWGVETFPLTKYDFSGCIRKVEYQGSDEDKWQADAAHKRVLAIEKELEDGYIYREDFGEETYTREERTAYETPSRAEAELGEGAVISSGDVRDVMRSEQGQ